VLHVQGIALFFAGDLEGAGACRENALASYAEIGYSEPFALSSFARLASVCCLTGELDRAIGLSEDCLRHCEALGDQWARGTALWIRGAARWLSGDTGLALKDTLACGSRSPWATFIPSPWRSTCSRFAWWLRAIMAGPPCWAGPAIHSHIEHIFSKLGFTSRAQIAAWVSRQDAR
jgi:hypothetical protein